MQYSPSAAIEIGEVLHEAALTADELAHACCVAPSWVHDRVETGILGVDLSSGTWRFDSLALVRARRLIQLEVTFDADPQLAALTTDLIEEVALLRQRLRTQSQKQSQNQSQHQR